MPHFPTKCRTACLAKMVCKAVHTKKFVYKKFTKVYKSSFKRQKLSQLIFVRIITFHINYRRLTIALLKGAWPHRISLLKRVFRPRGGIIRGQGNTYFLPQIRNKVCGAFCSPSLRMTNKVQSLNFLRAEGLLLISLNQIISNLGISFESSLNIFEHYWLPLTQQGHGLEV